MVVILTKFSKLFRSSKQTQSQLDILDKVRLSSTDFSWVILEYLEQYAIHIYLKDF